MSRNTRIFYQYLGLHSLLIGIFPFYIPVYLWKQGFDISEISFFIALSGTGFCIGMWVWDRLRCKVDLITIIGLSLLLEVALLLNVQYLEMRNGVLMVLGITYGFYNSFFWTTQRALFFELVEPGNSGRKYGNFQIFVGLLLQVGILIGGFLLEKTGFENLLYISAVIAIVGFFILYRSKPRYPATLHGRESVKIKRIFDFRDAESSRTIFIIDGFYLFLESFFWVITLFLLAHESFATLGLLVMGLAVIFGVLFYLLKNSIDKLGRKRVYTFAVFLYVISWALRGLTDDRLMLEVLFVFLVVITFCTSFFRLAMNKRFYDIAKLTISHDYLILKSYYSQITIAVIYGAIGVVTLPVQDSEKLLTPIYWISAAISLMFLLYGASGIIVKQQGTPSGRLFKRD